MNRVAVVTAMFCLQAALSAAQTVDQLVPHRVKLTAVDYKGKRAVKVVEDGEVGNGEAYAVLKGTAFHNGTIEVELADPVDVLEDARELSGHRLDLLVGEGEPGETGDVKNLFAVDHAADSRSGRFGPMAVIGCPRRCGPQTTAPRASSR